MAKRKHSHGRKSTSGGHGHTAHSTVKPADRPVNDAENEPQATQHDSAFQKGPKKENPHANQEPINNAARSHTETHPVPEMRVNKEIQKHQASSQNNSDKAHHEKEDTETHKGTKDTVTKIKNLQMTEEVIQPTKSTKGVEHYDTIPLAHVHKAASKEKNELIISEPVDSDHETKSENSVILVDPTFDRVCSEVPFIAMFPLSDDDFYLDPERTRVNTDKLSKHFIREGLLTRDQIDFLVVRSSAIFDLEPNCVHVPVPVNICGDIHGQYYDLMKLLKLGGSPRDRHYLFMGDYVDRGSFSSECLFYLLALKISYPDKLFILRGNHESKHLTQYFTFKLECMKKYDEDVYLRCLSVFQSLPPCAVVNNQLFCTHGGISPQLKTLADVETFDRRSEPNVKGLFCDLLWSDPAADYDTDTSEKLFIPNKERGTSYSYYFKAVKTFLDDNNLLCLVRGHQAQVAGYRMYKKNPTTNFPSVITLFSAPNYVDVYKNKAAILMYNGDTLHIRQFTHSPHSYWLPKFMDVFSWSVPFICEKILDILVVLLNTVSEDELHHDYEMPEQRHHQQMLEKKVKSLKQKIQAVSKVTRVYSILRTEAESVVELKNLMKSTKLPAGTLSLGVEGLRKAITSYDVAWKADLENEHLPPLQLADNVSQEILDSVTSLEGQSEQVQHALEALENNVAPSFHLVTEDSPMIAILDTPPLTDPASIGIPGHQDQLGEEEQQEGSFSSVCSFFLKCLPKS